MKAGVYYVGDLCYVIKDNLWQEFLKSYFDKEKTFHGSPFWMESTENGDGNFLDNYGRSYLVDSGAIGVVGVDSEFIDLAKLARTVNDGYGNLKVITEDFEPVQENGVFDFGGLKLKEN